MNLRRLLISFFILCNVHITGQHAVYAQDALYLVTPETTVRKISFKFPEGNATFEPEELVPQLVTVGPTFWDRFDKLNPFKRPEIYPFDAIELQKDVVRLRQFYQRNGFPTPRISYSASQFNAKTNRIHVIFAIWEGAPLFVEQIQLISADSVSLTQQLPASLRDAWRKFSEDLAENTSRRFTDIELLRIQDLILRWFQNNGFAFAQVDAQTEIDEENRTVNLKFLIKAGPIGYFSTIDVEGNQTVSNQILLRRATFCRR